MHTKYFYLIFLVVSLVAQKSFAEKCFRVKFSYIEKKQKKEKPLRVCQFNKYMVSEDCLNKKCGLLQKKIPNLKKTATGSPLSKKCLAIGGFPATGDIYHAGRKLKSKSFCFTKNMNSYLELGLLKDKQKFNFR